METDGKKKYDSTKKMMISIMLISILLLFMTWIIWPFTGKVSGDWQHKEKNIILRSEKNKWKISIQNYEGMEGYTLFYNGEWNPAFMNIYDGYKVMAGVEIDRNKFDSKMIDNLFVGNNLFNVVTNNKEKLVVMVTNKGMDTLFGKQNIDTYFHFKLEGIPFLGKEIMYLNSPLFGEERLPFVKR